MFEHLDDPQPLSPDADTRAAVTARGHRLLRRRRAVTGGVVATVLLIASLPFVLAKSPDRSQGLRFVGEPTTASTSVGSTTEAPSSTVATHAVPAAPRTTTACPTAGSPCHLQAAPLPNEPLAYLIGDPGGQAPVEVRTIRADGSQPGTLLTRKGIAAISWAPQHAALAFAVDDGVPGDGGLFVSDPDGQNIRKIVDGPAYGVAWSPSGDELAFSRQSSDGMNGLVLVRPDGTGVRPLTDPTTSTVESASWSPDGTTLVAQRLMKTTTQEGMSAPGNGVVLVDGATGAERLLVSNADTGRGNGSPSWSPDGRWIVYSSGPRGGPRCTPQGCSLYDQGSDLWAITPDGAGNLRLMAPGQWSDQGGGVWSSDGRFVAFARYDIASGKTSIQVMDWTTRKAYAVPNAFEHLIQPGVAW
jgi:hypothetical protein